jgi:hypothetical protein
VLGLAAAFAACGSGGSVGAARSNAGADGTPAFSFDASPESVADAPVDASALADAADSDAVAASCGPLPVGTSSAADAGDVSYSWTGAPTACFGEPFCKASCSPAFLQSLLDCDAVEGGYFWNFGSVYIRVAGRRGGSCVYDIGLELEGAVTYKECTSPIPVAPWPGLQYANGNTTPAIFDGLSNCTLMGSCSVQPGIGMPCDQGPAGVPLCPASPSHC